MCGIDCLDLLHKGYNLDGPYIINPQGKGFMRVFCDQSTNGGGWSMLQRRFDGSLDFSRDWNSYKVGFGNLTAEFWLGNDNIHVLTSIGSQILIELKDFENNTVHGSYGSFHVGNEAEQYVLEVNEFSGTAGDSITLKHNGAQFTTKDRNNSFFGRSCSQPFKGAWWYVDCHDSNLNGEFASNHQGEGINWKSWKGKKYSLKETTMKVRSRRGKFFFLVKY